MPRVLTALAAATVTMIAAVGCGNGGPSAADKARASARASRVAASASASAAAASASAAAEQVRARKQQVHDTCQTGTAPLLGALHQIDSRLDVGLNYSDYSDRVGDARGAYDQMIDAKLGRQCLVKVGVSAEAALNQYLKAYRLWNDCINDYSCDFTTGDNLKTAQTDWGAATELIKGAETGLATLGP